MVNKSQQDKERQQHPQKNTRAVAVSVLIKVLDKGEHFHPMLISQTVPDLSREDLSFISNLCFGVLRYYFRLMACLHELMPKPLKAKDRDLALLLLVGLYQLFYLDLPEYAIVHSTVEAVPGKKKWARALLNAVFREALRQKSHFIQHALSSAKTAHSAWLTQALQSAWPDHWKDIVAANLTPPPFSLRVNSRKITRENYVAQLSSPIIPTGNNVISDKNKNDDQNTIEIMPFSPTGFILSTPRDVHALPGFKEGWISVQDGAAQLAATLLDLQENQRILDACAAPGGKTTHILETAPVSCEVWALDQDAYRLERLHETLQRLDLSGPNITILCKDAAQTQDWWDGNAFDRILLDVPCSATGVIRRHPDIQHHRQPSDILILTAQQQLLLTKMWPLLKPGGILIYATCSILPAENVAQMEWFLHHHNDAKETVIDASWGIQQSVGRQILPGQHNMDGFYYARLRKIK